MTGDAERKDVLRILGQIQRQIHGSVLPRERGDYSTHATRVRPILPGQRNVEAYIDEFKDLVDLSRYTDPITIVLKFHCSLNPTTQDRIAESGTDRPQDQDFNGWFKAARHLDLDHLPN
jgi:hypothetical protein